MSTDAPFQPPRKKVSIFWWLGGGFLILLLFFVYQLFGPNPPIIVSPQTTYITTPLGPDGLPDYEQYAHDQCRKRVTPEDNAAALLWPALWPGELDPPQYAAVAAELGLKSIPSEKDALTSLHKRPTRARITAWLHTQYPAEGAAVPNAVADMATLENNWTKEDPLNDVADTLVDQAMSSPWTSEQIPPLALWVTENQKPMDKMVEASARSRCYFPSPSYLNNEQELLITTLLPGVQSVRMAGRALGVRAMWHLGAGRQKEAWRDLFAMHRIGRLTAQGQSLVEKLVGIAISGIARDGTLSLLNEKSLTAERARQVQSDLQSLKDFDTVADSLDTSERLSFLDAIIWIGVRKSDSELSELGLSNQATNVMNHVRVNWNVALQEGNEFYDRLVTAARLPDRQARAQAMSQIDADLQRRAQDVSRPGTLVGGVINPGRRSEIAASAMLTLFLPALSAAINAEERANTTLDLEQLAAALAVHRAEHGNYPAKLEELVPSAIEKLPVDLYNSKPLIYKRTTDGYLLYSCGDNGKDDNGSNESDQVVEGQPTSELDEAEGEKLRQKIPAGADDWSIRIPLPLFKMPAVKPQPATGENP